MEKHYSSIDQMIQDVPMDVERIRGLIEDEKQIKRLAQYLINNHGDEIGKVINESAVDVAIRLLDTIKRPQRSNW